MDELARRRARADSKQWAPADCIADFASDITRGAIHPRELLIVWTEALPGGGCRIRSNRAGLNHWEEIALLHFALHEATRNAYD